MSGCYELKYTFTITPPYVKELAQVAWTSYGQTEEVPFTVLTIIGDCPDGRFHTVNPGNNCIEGEHWPSTNKIYLAHHNELDLGILCHEVLHAAIDTENGVLLDDDDKHTDDRWNNTFPFNHTGRGTLPWCYRPVKNAYNKLMGLPAIFEE